MREWREKNPTTVAYRRPIPNLAFQAKSPVGLLRGQITALEQACRERYERPSTSKIAELERVRAVVKARLEKLRDKIECDETLVDEYTRLKKALVSELGQERAKKILERAGLGL